jgi:small conductance mechanosensitive channel
MRYNLFYQIEKVYMQEYFSNWIDTFLESLPNVISAILIFVISYYVAVLFSRFLRRVLDRQNADQGVAHLLTRGLKWTLIALGIVTALQRFFDVTAFLAGLGIIGFTVGFALQNIMQNFVSGIILLVQRPFRVGHVVNIAGFDGTVLKIDLRTTEVKTLDGRIVFLPNGDVLAQPIINYTRAETRRVELPIGISYDSDTEKVRKIILDEIKKISGYLDSPEPIVLFQTFGASSIDLTVFFWVDTAINSPIAAKDTALTLIKKAFEKHNIEIPYPIQVQYNKQATSKQNRKAK